MHEGLGQRTDLNGWGLLLGDTSALPIESTDQRHVEGVGQEHRPAFNAHSHPGSWTIADHSLDLRCTCWLAATWLCSQMLSLLGDNTEDNAREQKPGNLLGSLLSGSQLSKMGNSPYMI